MSKPCQYGGQAVIEGVMMKGPEKVAIAVRKANGEVLVDLKPVNSITKKYPILKAPLVRGVVSLVESMVDGIKALTYSANQSLEEEEEELSPKEMGFTLILSLGLGILLFVIAPTGLTKLVDHLVPSIFMQNIIEGIIRITIFLLYIVAISRMKDIQRVFQYHGAEHKTIHAYEAGSPLIPAEVQKYSTLHPRCGTSFLLIVMVVSIFLFAFLGKQVLWWRFLSRVILMPVVAGISYEFIKYSGRHANSSVMKILITPGLWLQKLTTRQPDDSQVEVAIKSLEAILPEVKPCVNEVSCNAG